MNSPTKRLRVHQAGVRQSALSLHIHASNSGQLPPDIVEPIIFNNQLSDVRERTKLSIGGGGGVMTHKYRGSIIGLSISKSVKPNEEQKEMTSGFQ